jgi:very-short-patch-repair endonuclease
MLNYNPELKTLARELRRQGVLSEVLLWQQLKGKQIQGLDFHRQKPIDDYIVDFFCPELMLAIEIDGESHREIYDQDQERQARLETLGITFLRYRDEDVKTNLSGVIQSIIRWIQEAKDRK